MPVLWSSQALGEPVLKGVFVHRAVIRHRSRRSLVHVYRHARLQLSLLRAVLLLRLDGPLECMFVEEEHQPIERDLLALCQ